MTKSMVTKVKSKSFEIAHEINLQESSAALCLLTQPRRRADGVEVHVLKEWKASNSLLSISHMSCLLLQQFSTFLPGLFVFQLKKT